MKYGYGPLAFVWQIAGRVPILDPGELSGGRGLTGGPPKPIQNHTQTSRKSVVLCAVSMIMCCVHGFVQQLWFCSVVGQLGSGSTVVFQSHTTTATARGGGAILGMFNTANKAEVEAIKKKVEELKKDAPPVPAAAADAGDASKISLVETSRSDAAANRNGGPLPPLGGGSSSPPAGEEDTTAPKASFLRFLPKSSSSHLPRTSFHVPSDSISDVSTVPRIFVVYRMSQCVM